MFICSFRGSESQALKKLVTTKAPGRFTVERPENGILQFLDLCVHVEGCLCWEYGNENEKPLSSKKRCHANYVKAGAVKLLLKKPCGIHVSLD